MTDLRPPRKNPDLRGHEEAEKILLDGFHSRRLAHAWLISGPQGIGKATLAYRFARYVLAQGCPGSAGEPEPGPGLFGDETPAADAEVITAAAAVLERCGLSPKEVRIKISHRAGLQKSLLACGAAPDALDVLLVLIDRLDRLSHAEFDQFCAENDIDDASREAVWKLTKTSPDTAAGRKPFSGIYAETDALRQLPTSQGVADWIAVNPPIVPRPAYNPCPPPATPQTGATE